MQNLCINARFSLHIRIKIRLFLRFWWGLANDLANKNTCFSLFLALCQMLGWIKKKKVKINSINSGSMSNVGVDKKEKKLK